MSDQVLEYAVPYHNKKSVTFLTPNDPNEEEDCQAIPFIKFVQEQGKFELEPEAEEFLKSLGDTKLGVVAVCGKYRTGKSYLLNKLFVETYFQKKKQSQAMKGFQVSPTINACTKGLWLWKRVIKVETQAGTEVSMIVVDTEGLGAYDEDENHDAKIFLLAMLLSSLLIYNSVGTIDENALNSLSLVINLSKKIQLKAGQDSQEDVDSLAKMFPCFLWVLRDFALKLVDSEGNRITPKQYLENSLREQKGCSEAVEQKNRLRRLLAHFFPERDCCTLVRPTEQEKDLQSLARLPESELRQEFVEQMGRLKQKVFTRVKVKQIKGHAVNGSMLVELANSYIVALNDGEVPVIENVWTNVCHFEQERCFKTAQELFQSQIVIRLKLDKSANLDVKAILREIRELAINALKKDFIGEVKALEHYKNKLQSEIKRQSKNVVQEVQQRIDQGLAEKCAKRIQEDLEARVRRGDSSIKDFDTLFSESEKLLILLQSECHENDKIEAIFRKVLHLKLAKMLNTIHTNHCQAPSISNLRTIEHQLKMANEDGQRFKDEKMEIQRESFEKASIIERERQTILCREKVLEIKLSEAQNELKAVQRQLKLIQTKEISNYGTQTEVDQSSFQQIDRAIQAVASIKDQVLNTEPESNSKAIEEVSSLTDAQVNTSLEDLSITTSIGPNTIIKDAVSTIVVKNTSPEKKSQTCGTSGCPPQYLEKNMKLLQDILTILNNNSMVNTSSQQSDFEAASQQFEKILQNNQVLSRAIEQAERRCNQLEKKLDRKSKFENLVKNCQRLQCKECNKLYTPSLFAQHAAVCFGRQQSNRPSAAVISDSVLRDATNSSRRGNSMASVGIGAVSSFQLEDTNNIHHFEMQPIDQDQELQEPYAYPSRLSEGEAAIDNHHYEGGEPIKFQQDEQYDYQDINHRRLSAFLQKYQQQMNENGDQFLAKIINVQKFSQENYRSPYFKSCEGERSYDKNRESLHSSPNVELHFCVFNKGTVQYLKKSLFQVKNVMSRIQRRVKSPSEQSQIAKWVLEIERNEQDENFKRIADIIESFFATIHHKIVENSLQLNKHVIIEDIDGISEPQHLYVNEFVEFFEISDTQGFMMSLASAHQVYLQQQETTSCGEVRPFNLNQSVDYRNFEKVTPPPTIVTGNRYTLGGDDEVLLQTPYDEDEACIRQCQRSNDDRDGSSCLVIQEDSKQNISMISQDNVQQMLPQAAMHQEEEHSMFGNCGQHAVSFLSGQDERAFIKKNLMNTLQTETSERFDDSQSSIDFTESQPREMYPMETQPQPFQAIQNTLNAAGSFVEVKKRHQYFGRGNDPNSQFAFFNTMKQPKVQRLNNCQINLTSNGNGFQVMKKSFQSPLFINKKQGAQSKRPLNASGFTNQHQGYFKPQHLNQQQHQIKREQQHFINNGMFSQTLQFPTSQGLTPPSQGNQQPLLGFGVPQQFMTMHMRRSRSHFKFNNPTSTDHCLINFYNDM